MMVSKSLAFRIIASSGIWIIMVLVITALLLVYFYRDHTAQHYDEHVSMHLEELIEASSFLADGTFNLTFNPSDPRYHELHSGWYWEVQQAGTTLKRSFSLGKNSLNTGNFLPATNLTIHEIAGPSQEELRVHVVEVRRDPTREPLVFIASAPMTGITDDVKGYSNHIITSFVALGIGLLLAVFLQVRIALKPLQAIGTGIGNIRNGTATRLPEDYPEDVQPLVDELNNLLEHNTALLKRARTQLGDLAHSVKNPLTVISNEARSLDITQRDLILHQAGEITRSIDHYLSRARAFGAGNVLGARSNVKAVVEDLVFAMQRIYQVQHLEYDLSQLNQCWFKGEGQDLEEMLGNLIDNACKWAESRVVIRCQTSHDRLILIVEDDGPGVPEEKLEDVMHRGRKLDESKPGHGQGLGIVNDIADLYGGSLKLGKNKSGGFQAELNLPAA